jgi:hypothetical protein
MLIETFTMYEFMADILEIQVTIVTNNFLQLELLFWAWFVNN